MKRNNKTLRLTEQEFNTLIEESVKNAINEIKWGKVGDALAAGALGAGLTLSTARALTSPEQSDYWPEEDNITMVYPDDPDYDDFEEVETDAPEVPEDAWKLNGVSESKIRRIVRSELSKVL